MKRVLAVIAIAFLAGCATPQGMKRSVSDERIVYEMPAEGVYTSGFFSGIAFAPRKYECLRSGFKFVRHARIVAKGADRCEITLTNTMTPAAGTANPEPTVSEKTYIFTMEKREVKGARRLEFAPLFEPAAGAGQGKVSAPDTIQDAMELIATSGMLTFHLEVDSDHDMASVKKNLQTLLKERPLPYTFNLKRHNFTTSYLLLSGGNTVATFFVSVTPTKSGSRSVVIGKAQLAPDDKYRVDAVTQIADLKKLITDAINY